LELTANDFIHEAGAFQGCGEFNPVYVLSKGDAAELEREERNLLNAPNRRVMVFFFEQGTVIDKGDWPCPKWDAPAAGCHKALWPDADTRRKKGDEAREYRVDRRTMGCRFYDRMARRSPCEGRVKGGGLGLLTVEVHLHGVDGRPMTDVCYRLTVGRETKTGVAPDGWVVERVSSAECGLFCHVEWGPMNEDGSFPFANDLTIECENGGDQSEAEAKLHNLGYTRDLPLEFRVSRFQSKYESSVTGLTPEGKIPVNTVARVRQVYGNATRKTGAAP
jgi:hypothetical protein